MNKALLPLVEKHFNFQGVSPSLFGPEIAQKSKELVDQVKAMWSTITTPKQFFDHPPGCWLYLQARPRRNPELPERQPPHSGEDSPKELEQVTQAHTF